MLNKVQETPSQMCVPEVAGSKGNHRVKNKKWLGEAATARRAPLLVNESVFQQMYADREKEAKPGAP